MFGGYDFDFHLHVAMSCVNGDPVRDFPRMDHGMDRSLRHQKAPSDYYRTDYRLSLGVEMKSEQD